MANSVAAALSDPVSSIACRRSALPGPSQKPGRRTTRKRRPLVSVRSRLALIRPDPRLAGPYRRSTMDGAQLKAAQAPLKQRYRDEPNAALVTLSARGAI